MNNFDPESKRVSKPAERFTSAESPKKKPALVIPKGNGVKLGEIPYSKQKNNNFWNQFSPNRNQYS